MNLYELTLLLPPDLKEEELEKEKAKIEELTKGKFENEKKIKLAYPVKKREQAFLLSGEFEAEKIKEIKKELDKEPILRFLLIKKEKAEEKQREKPKEKKPDLSAIEKELEKVLAE